MDNDFEIGMEVTIQGKKLRVLDYSTSLYVYKDTPAGREETTIFNWYLEDADGTRYFFENPTNKDRRLVRLYKEKERPSMLNNKAPQRRTRSYTEVGRKRKRSPERSPSRASGS